ncbi:3-oxoadipate enol-lactonase [Qingshengfaniella alkalisoli]|uniref:3-oxoadipate enol-lactonase n=1 Tax=Qingshengfaniella alkalisoli TaxID=2599296 RepID=A0A5B8I6L5_9RHOB|nr:3-oxoadipate enol-lactonase [Qingshengfaniella alkalisoli]QDY69089.1 3-oxoadipate enol-lactonase [Qingshengfaniella alkalisoli]
MFALKRPWGHIHYKLDGAAKSNTVLFINSLGTDLRMWDAVVAQLPTGMRVVRFDKPGHGLSADRGAPFDIDDMADDAMALLDAVDVDQAVVVGCSIGGMIAQSICLRYTDRVTGVVFSNTAPKIGTAESWADRIRQVRENGINAISDAVLDRWFAPALRASDACNAWKMMLERTTVDGYAGCCRAISRADYSARIGDVHLPALVLAGAQDQATPSDQVKAFADEMPQARFTEFDACGHIPAIEQPEATARALTTFIKEMDSARA